MSVVSVCPVAFMVVVGLDTDGIYRRKSYTAFGPNRIRQRANTGGRALQNHCFKRRRMIEDHVCCCHDKIMIVVLQIQQPLRQRSSAVVVDIRKIRNTMRASPAIDTLRFYRLADQVANSFRPALIALVLDDLVEQRRDFAVKRNGYALHKSLGMIMAARQ